MKCITEIHDRSETIFLLEELSKKGYRYLVRDNESQWLSCYSLKPKKYRDTESWGYVNPDIEGVKMAYVFKNWDFTEVNWSNKSAKLISEFLERQ